MILNVTSVNQAINQNMLSWVKSVDDDFYNQIKNVAKSISENASKQPVVLISGPSGSGKTTSALMLQKALSEFGYTSYTVSMDNYFLPFTAEEFELFNKGLMDLESPERIDRKLLDEHIEKIINCEYVEFPRYDFTNSKRYPSGKTLKREKNDIVIFEGIHALNPDVITMHNDETAKIYVSVRTRLRADEKILHPSKIRLARRIIRDFIHRGRSFIDTINMYNSVEEGEQKYIMPYKYRSNYDIDTFLPYELGVYKEYLKTANLKINSTDITNDLIEMLENTMSINSSLISKSSLIREFIGDSNFSY